MDNLHIFVTENIPSEFSREVVAFGKTLKGPWSFFASGGSLAPDLYGQLASNDEFGSLSDNIQIYLGDERVVDPQGSDSNMFNLRKSLLEPLSSRGHSPKAFAPFTKQEFLKLSESFSGALPKDYVLCNDIADSYGAVVENAPKPWLIHLGVGPDGHTASLFPRSPAFTSDTGRICLANYDPNGRNPFPRLTLSLEAISQAELVIITTSGQGKAKAIESLLGGNSPLPIAQVKARKVALIIDYEAASLIDA